VTTFDLVLPLLGWAIANLFLFGLTRAVGGYLRVGSSLVDPLIYGWLYIFLTTTLVMVCALLGLLRPLPIFALSLAGGAVLGWFDRAWLAALPVRVRGNAAQAWAGWRQATVTERATDIVFIVFVLFLTLRFAVHIWFLPPYVWDALSYHLPNVAEWIQSGRLVLFETPVDRTFWPANYELFEAWFVVFPHHDILIDVASIPFYLLASASVGAIARSIGLAPRVAAWAALAYALTPAPLLHATSSNNDLPTAATYLLILAVLFDGRRHFSHPRRRLLFVALALALALGTKASIVFLLLGLVVATGLVLWRQPHRELWQNEPAWGGSGRAVVTLLLAAAVLLAGYWYVRNAFIFGNPFYPAEPRLFGEYFFDSDPLGRQRQGGLASGDTLSENLEQIFSYKLFDREPFNYSLRFITGWGWLVFCCGWPALAWGILTRSSLRWLALIFSLSMIGLLSSVVPDAWNLRFALWFPALPILAFVSVMTELRDVPARRALATLAIVCMLLNVAGTLDIGSLSPSSWRHMASLPVTERSTAALGLYIGREYYDALDTVPAREAIGYNTDNNGWIYPLYDADLSHAVRYVPIGPQTDVVAAMRQRQVRYLFISLPLPVVYEQIAVSVAQGRLRQIGKDLYVISDTVDPR
jgi:hypothetical protein